jgi:methionyl aminopeptidase
VIIIKTDAQIDIMRKAGKLAAKTMQFVGSEVKAGVKTSELDSKAEDFIVSYGAIPGFKGYRGFPATLCVSIDEEVVHGIPGERTLVDGQIVSVDLGVIVDGFYGDIAATFPVGEISEKKRKLLEVTKRSLEAGIGKVKAGVRLGEVSNTIQTVIEDEGFSVVREMIGHGIGKNLHEAPDVPNFGQVEAGPVLEKGMTLAIEPMVNIGDFKISQKADGWTIVTADGSTSAHFEHTVAVTDSGADILTLI